MTKQKVKIEFLPVEHVRLEDLTYVVIGAREENGWIFVRHRERKTWELPAGHIEKNEPADAAARRELYEETGTTGAEMQVLTDYAVTIDGKTSYGRLYFARVTHRASLPESEIGENRTSEISPLPATYPTAHNAFLNLLEDFIGHSNSNHHQK